MMIKFTTDRGAQVTISCDGSKATVAVAGRGEFIASQYVGNMIHLWGQSAKIEVPAAARDQVKAVFAARLEALKLENASYYNSDEQRSARLNSAMSGHYSNH